MVANCTNNLMVKFMEVRRGSSRKGCQKVHHSQKADIDSQTRIFLKLNVMSNTK